MKASESLKLMGKAVAYYPKLAKPLGGVSAAVLFCHFFYWHDKTDNPLGVYKTAEQIEDETGLTLQEQRTARAKLRDLGLLIETDKRIEHRKYFRLDIAVFDALMEQHSRNAISTFPKCNINTPEIQNQHSGTSKSTFDEIQNQQSYKGALDYQENTTRDYNTSLCESAAANSPDSENADAKIAKPVRQKKRMEVPIEEIVAAYNEVTKDVLPAVQKINDQRERALKARWRETINTVAPNGTVRFSDRDSGIEWWGKFFGKVLLNDRWIGKSNLDWAADFDWIIKSANFVKILEWVPVQRGDRNAA